MDVVDETFLAVPPTRVAAEFADPAEGISLASRPIDQAQNRQATRASSTDSGSEPPANAAPAGIEAAMAAPGAISVMLWNVTSRRPIASRRRPGELCVLGDVVMVLPDAEVILGG